MASSSSTMEKEVVPPTTPKKQSTPSSTPPKPAKKRGSLNIFRAALFMARRRSATKKAAAVVKSDVVRCSDKGLLKTLVCGIRPLHHPQLENHPASPLTPPPVRADSFHDVQLAPPSPADSSVGGMSSRYASAEDLHALDTGDDCEVDGGDAGDGIPNAIDVKAEEFIAKFYEQMRLQRMESMERF